MLALLMGQMPGSNAWMAPLAREMVDEMEAELDGARADRVAVMIKGILAMDTLGVGAMDGDLKTWAEAVNAAWPDPGSPDIPRIEEALGPREEVELKLLRMFASVRRGIGLPDQGDDEEKIEAKDGEKATEEEHKG